MKRILTGLSLFLLVFFVAPLHAQEAPFFKDIQRFKKLDSAAYPPKNAILLVGSSSFTKWRDVQNYFPNRTIINRGFGGSTLPDVIRYENDVIIPYEPKQVIVYCGDNDLASSDTVSAQTVLDRFTTLFTQVREKLPSANIAFVSIKPSPSRERLMDKMKEANELIRSFLKKQKNTAFMDVFQPMLLSNGKANPELFVEDNLHMNEKGYAIWKKVMEPKLVRTEASR